MSTGAQMNKALIKKFKRIVSAPSRIAKARRTSDAWAYICGAASWSGVTIWLVDTLGEPILANPNAKNWILSAAIFIAVYEIGPIRALMTLIHSQRQLEAEGDEMSQKRLS
jgi:hypothetical protein